MLKDLHWRLLLLGGICCIMATAATPYATLKLGQSVDLSFGAMFVAAALWAKRVQGKELAVELNILQSMIGTVSGVAFMVVIMAAFYYVRAFGYNIDFNPTWWQVCIMLILTSNIGVFMGIWPRTVMLKDRSLPWPASQGTLTVVKTLADSATSAVTKRKRDILMVSTAFAGFLTFLKDGLGVITSMVANPALNLSFSLEFMAVGFGMLVPISVGLSGLLGVWFISAFGETVAKFAALAGTTPEHWSQCYQFISTIG